MGVSEIGCHQRERDCHEVDRAACDVAPLPVRGAIGMPSSPWVAQVTTASEFLPHVVRITAERDLDLLEGHLLNVFRDMVGAARVSWLRLDPATDRYTLRHSQERWNANDGVAECAAPLREGGEISGAPPRVMDATQWAALVADMNIEHPLCLPGSDGTATVFPLHGDDHSLGFLIAHDLTAALLASSEACHQVLVIFRNYYALLEENQRDKLTGLLNRKTFDERIGKLLQIVAETGRMHPQDDRRRAAPPGAERFWLAVADIDHFKRINDTFGHLYGDEVLLLMAQIMKRTFRHDDLMFRFGGEEFVIVVGAPDIEGARVAFDKFRRVVADFSFPQIGKVTVSLGATEMNQRYMPSALVGRADEALYHAKHNGRDKLFFYEELAASGEVGAAPQQGSVELF